MTIKSIKAIYILMIAIAFGFLLFIINKGFRFSDEGYYLAGYNPNQPVVNSLSYFHVLVKSVFGYWSTNIIFVRILRICISISSSLLILKSVTNIFPNKSPLKVFTVAFLAIFISYTFGPQSLSYNSLNQLLLSIALYLLTSYNNGSKLKYLFYILLGITVTITSLNKITSGFSLLAFASGITFFRFKIKEAIKINSLMVLSTITAFIILNQILNLNAIEQTKAIWQYLSTNQASHDSSMIINTVKGFILQLKTPIVLSLGIFISTLLFKKYLSRYMHMGALILITVVSILLINKHLQIISSQFFFTYVSLWIAYYTAINFKSKDILSTIKNINHSKVLFTIALMVLPLVGAIGSDTGIFRNTLLYLPFWIIIPLILSNHKVLNHIYSISVSVLALSLGIYTIYFNPYRMEDLTNLNKVISHPQWPNTKIEISEAQYKKYTMIQNILSSNNFEANDYIFGMGDNIGYIYFLEGIQPDGFSFSLKNLPLYNALKHSDFKKQYILLNQYDNADFIKISNFNPAQNHIKQDMDGIIIYSPIGVNY